MAWKWFELVDADGNAQTSIDAVHVDVQQVYAFRRAVFTAVQRALPATTLSSDLIVFASAAAYDAKQPLEVDAVIESLGCTDEDAMIVQAPTRIHAQASPSLDDLRMVIAEHERRKSEYSMSTCTYNRASNLLRKLGYQYHLIAITEDEEEGTRSTTPPFHWMTDQETKEGQRDQYMEYIQRNLQGVVHQATSSRKPGTRSSARLRPKYHLKDTSQMKNLLDCDANRSFPFTLKGTADMMIVDNAAEAFEDVFVGLHMVIKVRQKDWGPDAQSQLLLELLAASLKSDLQCTPVALLTNLKHVWYFAWIAPSRKIDRLLITRPANGFAMIKTFLAKPTEELSINDVPPRIRFPSVSRLPKRQKLYADESAGGEDAASELMERYELVKDELEPEFLLARRMEYEFGLLKEMPIHSGMFP